MSVHRVLLLCGCFVALSCSKLPTEGHPPERQIHYGASNPVWIGDDRIALFVGRTGQEDSYEGRIIFEMDAFSGQHVERLSPPDELFHKVSLSTSHDKSLLVFAAAGYGQLMSHSQIYVLERATKRMRAVTAESHNVDPQLSPDGSKVLFESGFATPEGNIRKMFIQNVDGSGRRPVDPDESISDFNGHFLPNGKQVVLVSNRTWDETSRLYGQVYMMNLDGSNPINLDIEKCGSTAPIPSPNGGEMLMISLSDYPPENLAGLKLIDLRSVELDLDNSPHANKSKFRFLDISMGIPNYRSFRWSPNGEWIALLGSENWQETADFDVYVMRKDGSDLTRLTTGMRVYDFDWSPDGRHLAFVNRKEEFINTNPCIHIANVQTKTVRHVPVQVITLLSK